jgi:hypothetical protein
MHYRYTNLIKCILENTVCLTKYAWFESKTPLHDITACGFCGHDIRHLRHSHRCPYLRLSVAYVMRDMKFLCSEGCISLDCLQFILTMLFR